MSQKLPKIEGVVPILQTPFDDDGLVDFDSLRREVSLACDSGVKGVAFPGFASEWWKLSDEEIFECADVISACCTDSALFISNVTAQSTYAAVRQAKRFLELGADALMCLPPTLFPAEERAVLNHLRAVTLIADVPVILQYAGSPAYSRLSLGGLVSLHHDCPNFTCVKMDFSPAGPKIAELAAAFSGLPVTFLVGFAGLHLPDSLARGAHGLMPGTGHLLEDIRVFEALRCDMEKGLLAYENWLPLISFEMQTIEFSVAVHKWLLRESGAFKSEHIRTPGFHLDQIQKMELSHHLQRLRP